ncbi:hypothetical protein CQW23_34185 [Capsicum baccatum]|uniref:Protein TAR1 n=1 Tax=Capsicum baccatum TaxID=33114 RepID=A0A2G2UZS0_CAPBA|nr:hypothetical protein CQW23_34185 [Capsicum baccatum]
MPHSESRKTSGCDAVVFRKRPLDAVCLTVWNGTHATLEKQEADSGEGKANLSHDGLNPAHVPYWWVNNPTLGEFCFTMIGRADIEGSKSNVAMNAWLPQASYPCGNFFDTSTFEFRRSKGSLGHAFTMCRPSQTPHLTMSSARIGPQSEPWVQKEGQCPASDSRNNRIPLVRTSSELAVRRAGKAPEGTVPSPSPGRHAATRSRRGSSSSSPPTADGFGTGTPVPSPQSQSFSRSYGSILPTSLAYIVPSTRGCSPWRPDAVMSTTGRGRHSVLRIFKGRRERTGHHATCGALPSAGPYLRLSRFQGGLAVKQKRQLFPRLPPTSLDFLTLSSTATSRHSLPSFGSRQVCSHSNPSQKIKVGRRCTPRGDPTNQLHYALRVYSPVDSHTCQTPWSVFEDGSNGEATGQRPERADAEARQRRALPATIKEMAFHEHIKSPGFGRPPNPRWSTPRVDRWTGSSPFYILLGVHRRPPSASLPTISSTL